MITSQNSLKSCECHWKVFKGGKLYTERRTIEGVSQLTRNPPREGNFSATTMKEHHWFLSMASNSKVKSTRPCDLILIFRQLVLRDFPHVVPHSFRTAWQRPWQLLRVLVVLLHGKIAPAVLSIFSPKKTRRLSHMAWCLSDNCRRSEGLILLSHTTRIKLWRRLFLQ